VSDTPLTKVEPYLLEGTGPKIAFVSDPDGNQVELIER